MAVGAAAGIPFAEDGFQEIQICCAEQPPPAAPPRRRRPAWRHLLPTPAAHACRMKKIPAGAGTFYRWRRRRQNRVCFTARSIGSSRHDLHAISPLHRSIYCLHFCLILFSRPLIAEMKIVFLAAAVLLMCGAAWAVEMQVSAELDSVCIYSPCSSSCYSHLPLYLYLSLSLNISLT
jgi:hypothetical protein